MYPEIPVLSFISAALTLVPLIWYLRARNIAAVAIGVWLSITNVIYAVDALVWAGDTDIKASVWCDISTVFITGSRIALPAACLAVCIHLERLASQTSTSPAKRKCIISECLMCIGIPIMYILLHLAVQPRRFDLFYGFGCRAATYPSIATIFLVMVPPLLLTAATIVYAGIAGRHFLLHGVRFYGGRGSISPLTRNLYPRFVGMALLEAVLSAASTAVVMWGVLYPGLAPMEDMSRHLNEVLVWPPEAMNDNVWTVLETEWSVTVIQSVIFFGLFTCRMGVVREGWELIRAFLRSPGGQNLSVTPGQGASVRSTTSTSVPVFPTTVVDLSLVIQSPGMLTPYDHPTDKALPPTPGASSFISAFGYGTAEDEVVMSTIDPGMLPLESPSRSSAIASSHNSLASNIDPSQLVFSFDAWPRTPTMIPVRLPRHPLSGCSFDVPLAKSAVHVRSCTAEVWTRFPSRGMEKRQAVCMTTRY